MRHTFPMFSLLIGGLSLLGLLVPLASLAQSLTLQGYVLGDQATPLGGATLRLQGSSLGALADAQGAFSLTLSEDQLAKGTLRVTYLGYQPQEVAINGRRELTIELVPLDRTLDDVIITAVGIERSKREIGYATQELAGEATVTSRETNLVAALSAKVAGVQVTSASGSPGASAAIIIRGYKSINGSNEPLFVIDGVPVDNSYRGSNFTDQANRAIDINPNDIAELTVLKGPAATALYGIRAANGAIIITTKRGRAGATQVTFASTATFDQVNRLPGKQQRYAQGSGGRYVPDARLSWGPLMDTLRYDGAMDSPYDPNGNFVGQSDPAATSQAVLPYDNDGTFFQTGQRYENNLSLRGGSEQVRFFASMGHLYQLGVVPNTTFERISLRANTDFTLSDRLSLSVSANYIHSQGDRANRGSNLSGVMLGLMRTPPSFDLSNGVEDPATNPAAYVLPDGSQRTYHSSYDNPYWSINKNRSLSEVDRLIGYTEARYDPFSWLKLTYRLSADIYTNLRKSYWDNLSNEFGTGRMFDEFIRQQNLNSDLIVRIDPALDGPLSISAILGHNYNQLNEVIYEAEGFQFVLPDFYDLSNISQENLEVVDDLIFRRKLIGAYSDIKLGWKDYLFLDGTFRADWSSTLPASSNPFFSPSLSLSFIFSDAFGWKDAKVFSYGKLRLSAARGGNDAPFEYATGNYYLATTPTQGLLSYFPSAVVGNPSLLPVTTTSYEGGADLRLFSNRLRIDLTYYRAATTNQIFEADLPGSTGFASVLTNGGEILNEGIEAIIQGAILQPSEGLQWDVTVNFTRNRNTVVSISESLDNIALPSFGLASTSSRVIAGEAYGVLYGTRWLRNDAGDILVNDLGYPITDSLNGIIGNPNPDWLMGLRNSFRWGPWRLDFLFDIRQGGDMFNGTAGVMKNHGTHLSTETRAEDYVWPGVRASDGGVNTTPIQLDQAFYQRYPLAGVSEASVEEISWVRLREVNLGFALPAAWLKSLPLTQATLTLTGRNLWLRTPYSGIDPETTLSGAANSLGRDYFNMPNTRSYGANLILTF